MKRLKTVLVKMHRKSSGLTYQVCLALLFVVCSLADAKLIPNYTMDSLAVMSDDIVLCDELEVNPREPLTDVRCKSLKVFKGKLKPDDEFKVEYGSLFNRTLPPGRALLFLKRTKDSQSFTLISAKLIQNDKVLRFAQVNNPGGLDLIAQEPENIKLPLSQSYGESELINDLAIAMKKAQSPLQTTIDPTPKISLSQSIDRVNAFIKKGAKNNYSDKFRSSVSLVYVESHPRKGQAWVHIFRSKSPSLGGELSVYDYMDGSIIEFTPGP